MIDSASCSLLKNFLNTNGYCVKYPQILIPILHLLQIRFLIYSKNVISVKLLGIFPKQIST